MSFIIPIFINVDKVNSHSNVVPTQYPNLYTALVCLCLNNGLHTWMKHTFRCNPWLRTSAQENPTGKPPAPCILSKQLPLSFPISLVAKDLSNQDIPSSSVRPCWLTGSTSEKAFKMPHIPLRYISI